MLAHGMRTSDTKVCFGLLSHLDSIVHTACKILVVPNPIPSRLGDCRPLDRVCVLAPIHFCIFYRLQAEKVLTTAVGLRISLLRLKIMFPTPLFFCQNPA